MHRRVFAAVLVVCAAAVPAAAEAKVPVIHAHRGGSFMMGRAVFAENTMPAFRAAAKAGYVLELDTRVTADDGVIVLHDDSLDRTTSCSGKSAAFTLAQVRACPSDVLGSPLSELGSKPHPGGPPPPLLADVLAMARKAGATLNIEINDFDSEGHAANRVLDVIAASGVPARRLIIQSFFPPSLDIARQRIPGAARSVLALKAFGEGAFGAAASTKSAWVSPQWPVSRTYIRHAHARGLKVVPFTLDRPLAVRTATRLGVDAIITDDPAMARRVARRVG